MKEYTSKVLTLHSLITQGEGHLIQTQDLEVEE